jgi:hypothetical protein
MQEFDFFSALQFLEKTLKEIICQIKKYNESDSENLRLSFSIIKEDNVSKIKIEYFLTNESNSLIGYGKFLVKKEEIDPILSKQFKDYKNKDINDWYQKITVT